MSERGKSLIFLISQPRAGSTLLQRILGAHPDVHTTSEPWLMLHPLYALRREGHSAEYDATWSLEALRGFLEPAGGEETYLEGLRAWAQVVYGRALTDSGKTHFLDKTPRYYFVIPELRRVFPEARFVFLLRHPLAVMASILATWVRPHHSLWHYRHDLVTAPRKIMEAIDSMPEAAVVRYEELVTEPEPVVRELCRRLELPFDPAMLDPAQQPALGDRLGDTTGPLTGAPASDQPLSRWRRLAFEPEHRALALEYLNELGPELLQRLGYDEAELRESLTPTRAGGLSSVVRAAPELPWRRRSWPATTRGGQPWPRISIVTPGRNQARYIEEAMVSVLAQGYPQLEYVVMDGQSSDGSVEVIRRYEPWLARWISAPDAGQYDALNKGFALTTGEIMGWLNSDDLHFSWTLSTVASIFADCPEVQWLTTSTQMVLGENGEAEETLVAPGFTRHGFYLGHHIGERASEHRYVQQEATFWRRGLWEKAGGRLDANLTYAGDFELWARFYEHADLVTTTTPLAGFRRRAGQKTERMAPYEDEGWRVLDGFRHNLRGAARSPPLLHLARLGYRVTGRGPRALGGSRRCWVTWLPHLQRWVSGWHWEL